MNHKNRTLVMFDKGIARLVRLDEQDKRVLTLGSQLAEKAPDISLITEILCDRQGVFRLSGKQWTYENDPGSFFGTWYNEEPLGRAGKNLIEGERRLRDGDVLRIRAGEQMVLILYLEEGTEGPWKSLFLGDEGSDLWAGSDREACRIVLRSPGTGPRNTRFLKIEGDWYVQAGPAEDGTLLNGRPVLTRQRLRTGDLITAGGSFLVFIDGVLFYPEEKEEKKPGPPSKRQSFRIPPVFLTAVLALILCFMFLITQRSGDGDRTPVPPIPSGGVIQGGNKEEEKDKEREKAVNELQEDSGIYGTEPRRFSNSVFGSRYRRNEIRKIVFRDSLEDKAEDAWDLSEAGNGSIYAWVRDGELTIASEGIIALPPDCSGLFAGYTSLRTIDFGGMIDTSAVTDMESMFEQCYNLTALDLGAFDTSSVTTMSYMFSGCRSLSALMIGNFNTSHVTDMTAMFSSCNSLEEADLSSFDTRNVTGMEGIFQDCRELSYLDLTAFDTSLVESGRSMFSGCYSLEVLDFSAASFRTGSMTDMYAMFKDCYQLKALDVSGFDTSKVRDMSYMFYKDRHLTYLDYMSFDMSSSPNTYRMLTGTRWE